MSEKTQSDKKIESDSVALISNAASSTLSGAATPNDGDSSSEESSQKSQKVSGGKTIGGSGRREERHYWISTYPFFETSIFLSSAAAAPVGEVVHCQIYDADGNSINELQVLTTLGGVSVLELDQFLAACKMESGLKYAHLVVRLPAGVEEQVRIHTRLGSSVVGPTVRVADRGATFFPIDVREERSHFVALVNHSLQPAMVKLRLYLGRRSPEEIVTIPPLGARAVRVETIFGDCFTAEELGGGDTSVEGVPFRTAANDAVLQGYVRISAKSEVAVGVQLFERTLVRGLNDAVEGEVFTAVS